MQAFYWTWTIVALAVLLLCARAVVRVFWTDIAVLFKRRSSWRDVQRDQKQAAANRRLS
jgi:hypothetical protein